MPEPKSASGNATTSRTERERAKYMRPDTRVKTDRSALRDTERGLTPAQQKAVLAEEKRVRGGKTESAAIINANGEVVRRLSSRSAHNVSFEGVPNSELENSVIIHNHPGASQRKAFGDNLATRVGSPLSPQDLAFAAINNAAEIRAVTYSGNGGGYVYSVKRPEGGWPMRGIETLNLQRETRRRGRDFALRNMPYASRGPQQAARAELMAQWTSIQDMASRLGTKITRRKF